MEPLLAKGIPAQRARSTLFKVRPNASPGYFTSANRVWFRSHAIPADGVAQPRTRTECLGYRARGDEGKDREARGRMPKREEAERPAGQADTHA